MSTIKGVSLECRHCVSSRYNSIKDSLNRDVCSNCWSHLGPVEHQKMPPYYELVKKENRLITYLHIHLWRNKGLLLVCLISLFALKLCFFNKRKEQTGKTTKYQGLSSELREQKSIKRKIPEPSKQINLSPKPLPKTGIITGAYNGLAAPLMFKTYEGTNYYIKLEGWKTNKEVMTIFIRGGQKFEAKVPLGKYRVKYATGEVWYGKEDFFGPNTYFSQALEPLTFEKKGRYLRGHTISLYKVRNGNLRSKSFNKGGW